MNRCILLALLLACASCREPAAPAPLDEPFDLPIGAAARVSAADVTLRFLSVKADSRCPMNATCVWMGEATIGLEAERGSESELLEVTLPGRAAAPDSVSWTRWRNLRVGLVRLLPYPTAGMPVDSSSYLATLVVRRP